MILSGDLAVNVALRRKPCGLSGVPVTCRIPGASGQVISTCPACPEAGPTPQEEEL